MSSSIDSSARLSRLAELLIRGPQNETAPSVATTESGKVPAETPAQETRHGTN